MKNNMKKIYLAIPYSRMEQSSYEQVNIVTALLLNQGYNVFSPITHSHPLTLIEGITIPGTWEFWQKIDYQFIDWADEIFVVIPKEGPDKVLKSTGVNAEIEYGVQNSKPITFITEDNGEILYIPDLVQTALMSIIEKNYG